MKRKSWPPPDRRTERIYALFEGPATAVPPRGTIDSLDAKHGAIVSRILLARAIQLLRALTPSTKLPLGGALNLDELYLLDMGKSLSALDDANTPRTAGRRKRNLNALAGLFPIAKQRGRKSARTIQDDEKLLRSFAAEKSRLRGEDLKKSIREICDEVALHALRKSANTKDQTGGQGPSAAVLKAAKGLGKTIYDDIAKARGRIRRRRSRVTNTKK